MEQKVEVRESEWSAKNVFRYFIGTITAVLSIPVLFILDELDAISVKRHAKQQ